MAIAPAASPAIPAVRIAPVEAPLAATPTSRLDMDTSPSLAIGGTRRLPTSVNKSANNSSGNNVKHSRFSTA